jgi:methylmalonyl-CoA mutase
MEKAWGRHVPTTGVVQGAYSASFNTSTGKADKLSEYQSLLKRVEEFEASEGRRPRILVAKMGQDGHDRGVSSLRMAVAMDFHQRVKSNKFKLFCT